CGIIDVDVSDTVFLMNKKKVLDAHKFKVTPPTTPDGRWQTYIIDEKKGGRKKVSSYTEKGLYEKLYHIYFEVNAVTLTSMYPGWIERRRDEGISPRTVRRNENHWDKYYAGNPITQIPVHKLTSEKIENFFYDVIRKYNVTAKELGNMKFIMVDMMKLAKRRHYIEVNPMLDVEVKLNACRPPRKQNDRSRVYLPDEKEKLFLALNSELERHPENTDAYAIYLLFKLGVRIGELIALKWEDIDTDGRELHIHRMESFDENDQRIIVEYTKKKSPYGDRFLPLGDYEMDIFQKVKSINERYHYPDSEFIFCGKDGRTSMRKIDSRIRRLCRKVGIEAKSAHDIRRTVASEMFNNGVPVEVIRNYLGHSDIQTTFSYILDNNKKEETNKLILLALESMNGMKKGCGVSGENTSVSA
ncbi:MAG: site-specific integrase, partial [Lachnospiraceae bacterium]|nr:site-specific integrase [Lachnospiraceae bacterium]